MGGAHQLFNWVTNGASRQGLGQEKRRVKGAGRGKGLLVLTNGKEGRMEGREETLLQGNLWGGGERRLEPRV